MFIIQHFFNLRKSWKIVIKKNLLFIAVFCLLLLYTSVRRALGFDTSRRQSCRGASGAAPRLPRASRSGADAKRTTFNLTALLKRTDQTASIFLCQIPPICPHECKTCACLVQVNQLIDGFSGFNGGASPLSRLAFAPLFRFQSPELSFVIFRSFFSLCKHLSSYLPYSF